jgi:hypothetical protein
MTYSQTEKNRGLEKDFVSIQRSIRKSKTVSFKSLETDKYIVINNILRRKSTDIYFNEIAQLNPKTLSAITELLKNIGSFDFNIFELNQLVEKKTLHYILHDLFDSFDYFESLIDEAKYKNFIYKIIAGYSREVSYHNDIHAADVLQTTFMFLMKGELIQVSRYIYIRDCN